MRHSIAVSSSGCGAPLPSRAGKGFRDRAPDGALDTVSPRRSQLNGGKSDTWYTRHGGNRPFSVTQLRIRNGSSYPPSDFSHPRPKGFVGWPAVAGRAFSAELAIN